ncbi:MAG TPA: transposase domain-containing protein [Segetibacter sp.]|nr:transposase domain-containing protein [Segetibacter sp.]
MGEDQISSTGWQRSALERQMGGTGRNSVDCESRCPLEGLAQRICKMQGIDPHQWLKDVLTRFTMCPINKIKELLPNYSKPVHVPTLNSN